MESGKIQMVDLGALHLRLKDEIDAAMQSVIEASSFINGAKVREFAANLAGYLDAPHVIPCGNGTDALQIAMMRLELRRGDEIIVPAFTYASVAEAAILIGLKPVLADVDNRTFNILPQSVEEAITKRTKAIAVVHLFGQTSDMNGIMDIASRHGLFVIEDNAQSLGSVYSLADGRKARAGVIGDVGTLSFFPTKTLGCFGDGGAMITSNSALAEELRQTTVHGQSGKYRHRIIGLNSRLDTLQAAILDVKLKYIDRFIASRQAAAAFYNNALSGIDGLTLPLRNPDSTHVYNQYTIQTDESRRDGLQDFLRRNGVPSTVYYPLSIDEQEAFAPYLGKYVPTTNSRLIARRCLSLPIHTEMKESELEFIAETVRKYFIPPSGR